MEKVSKEKSIFSKINNLVTGNVLENLAYGSLIALYFMFFNILYNYVSETTVMIYAKVTSFIFLLLAIYIFERAYKNDDDETAIYGIEFLVLSIITLLVQHIPKVLEIDGQMYALVVSYMFLIYYSLKNTVLYTKEKKKELDSLSDIKEIVKDEPIKRQTKRRNKKEE